MSDTRTFRVWRAFDETLIVEGNEPVWEAPGQQGQLVAEIEAPDYDTACREWNESLDDTRV